jgi:large subunit ribosomal protein L5
MARLKELYVKELAPKLKEELGLANVMEVPRITKITLNMGVGEATGDKKILDNAVNDLVKIAGQKVVVTNARKSIAGFKIREDWPIGCKVTLRADRMYEKKKVHQKRKTRIPGRDSLTTSLFFQRDK